MHEETGTGRVNGRIQKKVRPRTDWLQRARKARSAAEEATMATWSYQGENQEHSSTGGQRPWVNKGGMLRRKVNADV